MFPWEVGGANEPKGQEWYSQGLLGLGSLGSGPQGMANPRLTIRSFSRIPGSPYYDNVRPLCYSDSDAVLLCFDISRPETVDSALRKVSLGNWAISGSAGEQEGISGTLLSKPLFCSTKKLRPGKEEICLRPYH